MVEQGTVVLISANAEWHAVMRLLAPGDVHSTALGQYFQAAAGSRQVLFFHGGWGKVSAAATTQFVIDQFHPALLINLGTCGGFAGHIERGTIILVCRTIIYDIIEQMSDPEDAISHYSTDLDLAWVPDPPPHPVQRGLLVSADRDIVPAEIPMLVQKYGAVAADWESGAIAWVAKAQGVPVLILRAVTDLVNAQGGEAYGNIEIFQDNTRLVMEKMIAQLPDWLECFAR